MSNAIERTQARVEGFPAIVWGRKSESVYIYVHGRGASKEEAETLALHAAVKSIQVISFDLPEHGENVRDHYPCSVQNGIEELRAVLDFAKRRWPRRYLYGSSLGAYFSLLAYRDEPFVKCLFLSPIVDMEKLIRGMMATVAVDENTLRERGEIPAGGGETLSWDYYHYVREHPVVKWASPTYILYGTDDTLTDRATLDGFVARFHCVLEACPRGEHYFHTARQLDVLNGWLRRNV